MALFKVYHGDDGQLPNQLKDSYGYIIVDDEATDFGTWTDSSSQQQSYGIGEWYIDTNTKRYRIAAATLVDDEGNFYGLDDIVQKDNLADDMVAAVYDDLSGQSKLLSTEREEFRVGIDVAKTDDSISKAFTITVPSGEAWEEDLDNEGYYKNVVTLPEALHCGASGATTLVPPTIIWSGAGLKEIYDCLEEVVLNDAKDTLTFRIATDNIGLTEESSLGVTIIDHR